MRKETLFFSGVLVFFVLVLATSAFAYENEVKSAAETLAQFMRESGKKTMAVVDFTDLQGNVLELGRFLAEELSISMASFAQKDFKVVDRTPPSGTTQGASALPERTHRPGHCPEGRRDFWSGGSSNRHHYPFWG